MPKNNSGAMHVATVQRTHRGRTYKYTLLRRSYRDEQGRVQKLTLANLTPLPDEAIELIKGVVVCHNISFDERGF